MGRIFNAAWALAGQEKVGLVEGQRLAKLGHEDTFAAVEAEDKNLQAALVGHGVGRDAAADFSQHGNRARRGRVAWSFLGAKNAGFQPVLTGAKAVLAVVLATWG